MLRLPAGMSAMPAPLLFEAFAFFRRHVHPALLHLTPPTAAAGSAPATAKTAKEDLGEDQQAYRLPEADQGEMKDIRHQSIPKQQHNNAEDRQSGKGEKKEQEQFWTFKTTSHDSIDFNVR